MASMMVPSNIRAAIADPKSAPTSTLAAVIDGHYIDVFDDESFALVEEEHMRRTDPFALDY